MSHVYVVIRTKINKHDVSNIKTKIIGVYNDKESAKEMVDHMIYRKYYGYEIEKHELKSIHGSIHSFFVDSGNNW
jgi:hypothetical protein